MQILDVLREASERIYSNVRGMPGTSDAGGDFGVGAGGDISKNIDLTAERAVLEFLKEVDFSCVVLGEECGRVELGSDPKGYIIMDAIDGTANAVRGFPFFCSSLAFATGYSLSSVEAGVIKNLHSGNTYWASRGRGAFEDGHPIQARRGEPGYTIVGVNLSGAGAGTLQAVQVLLSKSHVRHMGANALEMAHFSAGLMDAFVDVRDKIRIQDVAAGYLLVKEAGGLLLDKSMEPLDADLGYETRVSFVAAADAQTAQEIYGMMDCGALGGIMDCGALGGI